MSKAERWTKKKILKKKDRDAMLFENCLSHAPNTWSSFASILSGFLPHETKVLQYVPFPDGLKTLPGILQENGYETIAVVSNFVMHKGQGFEQGFMIYDDTMEDGELVRTSYTERIAKKKQLSMELEHKEYQLFDLETDPYEEHDLINDPAYQERAVDLRFRLKRISGEDFLGLKISDSPQKLTNEEKEKMRALGYVH